MSGNEIARFGIQMPEGKTAALEESDAVPVVKDLLAYAAREGAAALANRFSDEMLEAVQQDRETVRASLGKLGQVLGPLGSYDLGAPSEMQEGCREVKGRGKFEHGAADLTVHVCWSDGLWSLRHVQLTPEVTPVMVERMFAALIQGSPKATCPRDVAFPVGGEIVCRLELPGQPAQNAIIRRTSESGWQVVGVAAAPK